MWRITGRERLSTPLLAWGLAERLAYRAGFAVARAFDFVWTGEGSGGIAAA